MARMRTRKMPAPMVEEFEVGYGTKSFIARVLASLKQEGVTSVPARRFIPREKRVTTGFWLVRVNGSCYRAKRVFFVYPERLEEFKGKNPGEPVIAVSLGDRERETKKRIRRILFDSTN